MQNKERKKRWEKGRRGGGRAGVMTGNAKPRIRGEGA